NEGDLHANVPCRLLLYGENEFLLSSFFDDKAKYSCLNNNGSIAETLTFNYHSTIFFAREQGWIHPIIIGD
ncbi:MAG: hypothetical protein U0M94_15905, partial [Parabacteroides merdae]|nr:hypothetical protein [Parabacteroides merdae]